MGIARRHVHDELGALVVVARALDYRPVARCGRAALIVPSGDSFRVSVDNGRFRFCHTHEYGAGAGMSSCPSIQTNFKLTHYPSLAIANSTVGTKAGASGLAGVPLSQGR